MILWFYEIVDYLIAGKFYRIYLELIKFPRKNEKVTKEEILSPLPPILIYKYSHYSFYLFIIFFCKVKLKTEGCKSRLVSLTNENMITFKRVPCTKKTHVSQIKLLHLYYRQEAINYSLQMKWFM